MKNSKIFVYAALALTAFGMQSCLDYDTPGDEFNANQTIVPPVLSSGKADVIEYDKTITDAGVEQACMDLDNSLSTALTGVYGMRGGKEGALRCHTLISSATRSVQTTTYSTSVFLTQTSRTLTSHCVLHTTCVRVLSVVRVAVSLLQSSISLRC